MSLRSFGSYLIVFSWLTPAEAGTDLFFVANRGQAKPDIRFMVQSPHLSAYFKQTEIGFKVDGATLGFRLIGANPAAVIEGRKQTAGLANFLVGNEPEHWTRDVPIYEQVVYRSIYPGIDMTYGGAGHRLKSEFILAPGADPGQIRFTYVGVKAPERDADGALILKTRRGVLREEAPVAYQQTNAGRLRIESRFELFADGTVGFATEAYDQTEPLIIDPPISYSTYFGGTGMDSVTAIAMDASGSTYIAGWTDSYDLRVKGQAQSNLAGVDAFVAKFSADGQTLVYCTYLGGNGDDRAFGIAVDGGRNAYVTGWTTSTDLPTVNAFDRMLTGSRNAFVAKLNFAGNALVYSTYFGGLAAESGNGIAIDTIGSAYVVGETMSADLPVQNPYQGSSRGASDVFVMKLLPAGNGLVYSTYLGGRADDRGRAIAVDGSGAAYITGDTFSPDFPTSSAFQSASGGSQDAFVAKLTPSGGLAYSSYLGGTGGIIGLPETGAGIAVDTQGNAYVTGTTSSFNFPLVNAVQATHAGSQVDAFVAKINPLGSSLIFSTYLGGSSIDIATAIAVDPTGIAYVGGYTASTDFISTASAECPNKGAYDGFLAALSADGRQLLQSMCLGGTGNDAINGVVVRTTDVLVAGQTLSGDFAVKSGLQPIPAGSLDGFVAKISLNPPPTSAGLYYVAIAPCRVADTRWASGPFGGPVMSANSTRTFLIPNSSCNIPAAATAYAVNVSVVPREMLGFLAIWPAGQPQPVVSTLNSFDRRAKANAAIIPAGTNGGVNVFVTGLTDVALDITGYFLPSGMTGSLAFYPVTPCRLVDTRLPSTVGLGAPSLKAGETRQIPVTAGNCGIPATAAAYSANFTLLPQGPVSFINVWPAGIAMPATSTLNAATAAVTSNAVFVGAGTNRSINVYTAGNADLIVDVNGYFAPPATGGLAFYGVTPCRVVDTRYVAGPLGGPDLQGTRSFPLASGPCGLASTAKAYSLNATVVPQTTLGFLALWPSGLAIPVVSTLNSFDGSVVANAAIVPVANGSVDAHATSLTTLILDVNGYFAP